MSKAYRDKFGVSRVVVEEMRSFLRSQTVVDQDGRPQYLTEQAHKDTCDVNKIVRKYDKTGLIDHVGRVEAAYGDVTGVDFKDMQDRISGIKQKFEAMPNVIRKRFANDPIAYLDFMSDANNRDEAVRLGLIRNDLTLESDGIGEHSVKPVIRPPAPLDEKE